MSGRVPHRDRLRRKPTVELNDEVLAEAASPGEGRRVRSNSYSPVRKATPQEAKISRDFSVVTLETESPSHLERSLSRANEHEDSSKPKLSEELFSWRQPNGPIGGGSIAGDNIVAPTISGISEDLLSHSSEQSHDSFFGSEGGAPSKPLSTRRSKPASQRMKSYGITGKTENEEIQHNLRNEFITVGIGLLCLFFFTYVVQYCARHGYLKIPEMEEIASAGPHDEL